MKAKLGALVLHGFTSSLDTVNGLVPHLEQAGIPYRLPYLRGHGQTPDALRGVSYRDWVTDATDALDDLFAEVDEAVVVALSMGAMIALTLAVERPERIAGLALVAPYLIPAHPLAPFTAMLAKFVDKFPAPRPPRDEDYVCTNYTWFPTEAFVQVQKLQREARAGLERVHTPVAILASLRDTVAHPHGPRAIYERIASAEKQIKWFTRTGHEMMQGPEKEAVFAEIMEFIARRQVASQAASAASAP